MLRMNKKAQTAIEYVILLVILIGAFLGISNYFKRGVQGRWKAAVDDLGDQYDPRAACGAVTHRLDSTTFTQIYTMNTGAGYWTARTDESNMTERVTGSTAAGAY